MQWEGLWFISIGGIALFLSLAGTRGDGWDFNRSRAAKLIGVKATRVLWGLFGACLFVVGILYLFGYVEYRRRSFW
jgi:hypothetical protein